MLRLTIVLFSFIVTVCVQAQAGKYSKDKNPPKIDDPLEGRQFRMIKVQQLWEKAKKVRRTS